MEGRIMLLLLLLMNDDARCAYIFNTLRRDGVTLNK